MSTSSHSSRWQKGQSGNPGGRPKVIGDLQEQARQWSGEALEALREVATSKGCSAVSKGVSSRRIARQRLWQTSAGHRRQSDS